jgi:hypothetical protein
MYVSVKIVSVQQLLWRHDIEPKGTHFFNPSTEMVQGIRVDVSTGDGAQEVVLRQRLFFPLDEVNTLVLQRRGPVRMSH